MKKSTWKIQCKERQRKTIWWQQWQKFLNFLHTLHFGWRLLHNLQLTWSYHLHNRTSQQPQFLKTESKMMQLDKFLSRRGPIARLCWHLRSADIIRPLEICASFVNARLTISTQVQLKPTILQQTSQRHFPFSVRLFNPLINTINIYFPTFFSNFSLQWAMLFLNDIQEYRGNCQIKYI